MTKRSSLSAAYPQHTTLFSSMMAAVTSVAQRGRSSGFAAAVLLIIGCSTFTSFTVVNGFAPPRTTSSRVIQSKQHQQSSLQPLLTPSNLNSASSSQLNAVLSTEAAASASAASPLFNEETTQKLILLTFEKLIEVGIPAIFFVITTFWIISMMRGGNNNGDDMMGGRRGGRGKRGGGRGGRSTRGGRGGARNNGMFGQQQQSLGPVEELYDDIYDDLSGPEENVPPLVKLLSGGGGGRGGNNPNGSNNIDRPTSKLNIGIPKRQYLKVTKLNSKYDSYKYSLVKATQGKAVAAAELRSKGFESALWKSLGITTATDDNGTTTASTSSLGKLSPSEATALITLERDFLREGSELLEDVALLSREIVNAAVLDEMDEMGVEPGVIDAEIVVNESVDGGDGEIAVTAAQKDFFDITAADADEKKKKGSDNDKKKKHSLGSGLQSDIMKAVKEVESMNTQITFLELEFIQSIVEILGPNRADLIRTTIVGNMISGEVGMLLKTLKERPLTTVLSSLLNNNNNGSAGSSSIESSSNAGKNLYVTRFPGDVSASQLNELREEVTGILQVAKPGDEALLVLQSGGGTVTGYGLAAAQLQRFKAKNIKLTVCVEQVAASGGYMMCCTADRIVASPFAVLGSIGVISDVPNVYDRLQREGIEFQTITAGKYKRTITPTKKITKEDLKKSTEDIAEIFNLFKSFVASQRPQLDIENVATGDTWFGEDALARGLCDELATADDVLLDFVDKGYDLYEVAYDPTPEGVGLLSLPRGSSADVDRASDMIGWRGVLRSVVRGVVSGVKEEVMAELSTSMNEMNSVERRYMARDDSADRIKAQE